MDEADKRPIIVFKEQLGKVTDIANSLTAQIKARERSDEKLLTILRDLKWTAWEYDLHQEYQVNLPIPEVINHLALRGVEFPQIKILGLLARGKLSALASYNWKMWQQDNFWDEGMGSISPDRWQKLLDGLRDDDNWVSLENLGMFDVCKGYWKWQNATFSIASKAWRTNNTLVEEFYSAEDICVIAPQEFRISVEQEGTCTSAQDDRESEKVIQIPTTNKGGRPAIYDWERAVAGLVFHWADKGDWQPQSQAEVQRAMADWFADNGAIPAESAIKSRARWLFQEFERRKLEGQ